MKSMKGSDLLLVLFYSPGKNDECNEWIVGRTRLMKMVFLFEQELAKTFFKNRDTPVLPGFESLYFGPYSAEVQEALSFFVNSSIVIEEETDIPLSGGDALEMSYAESDDIWNDSSILELEFECRYRLSDIGVRYVEERLWDDLTATQQSMLRQFKRKINQMSLDSLLSYVYNAYPEYTDKSIIKYRYIKKGSENA